MITRKILLVGVAALAIGACGGKDSKGAEQSTAKARYKLSGANALDVDALFAKTGYQGEKPYGSTNFDAKIGATIINDIKLDDGSGNIVTIKKAELFGVDEEAINKVVSGAKAIDAPFASVLQKVRFYDINVQTADAGENFKMSLGGLEIDQLNIREGGINTEADEATIPAQIFNVFDLGGLYFKDFNFDMDSEAAGTFKMSAPDFRIVGLSGGTLKAMIANDLDYTFKQSKEVLKSAFAGAGPQLESLIDGPLGAIMGVNGQRVKAESFVWNGIDASGLLQYGLKGEMPPFSARNLISLGTAELKNMEQYLGDKKLLTSTSSTFKADEFTWLIPNTISADTKDATYDLSAYIPDGNDELLAIINKHGLNKVKGNGKMSWNWDDQKGGAKIDYVANTDKLADFSFTMDAGNLVFDNIAQALESQDQAAMLGIGSFKNLNLKIKDKNFLNLVYDIAANQMGTGSGDDLRQSAPAMLRLSGGQFTAINPLFEGYLNSFATFLGEGGTLEISAKPDEEIPMAQFAVVGQTAPQTIPNLLNLKVTHKK